MDEAKRYILMIANNGSNLKRLIELLRERTNVKTLYQRLFFETVKFSSWHKINCSRFKMLWVSFPFSQVVNFSMVDVDTNLNIILLMRIKLLS